MAYRPPTVSRTVLKGKAKVQKGKANGKEVLGVTFEDNTETTYSILRKDAPSYATTGMFYVRLSQDKTKIDSMSPLNGSFKVKTSSFPSKEGEEPAPYVVVNKQYGTSSEKFNVLLEVVGPKHAGMSILLILPYYWFESAQEEVKGKMYDVLGLIEPKKPSPGHRVLRNYLLVSGAWDAGPIQFKDNVLPSLQKRILRANKEFDVVLQDGFVSTIVMEDDEDFGEEKSDAPSSWGDEKEETETKSTTKKTEETTSWGEPDEAEEFTEEKETEDAVAPWNEV